MAEQGLKHALDSALSPKGDLDESTVLSRIAETALIAVLAMPAISPRPHQRPNNLSWFSA